MLRTFLLLKDVFTKRMTIQSWCIHCRTDGVQKKNFWSSRAKQHCSNLLHNRSTVNWTCFKTLKKHSPENNTKTAPHSSSVIIRVSGSLEIRNWFEKTLFTLFWKLTPGKCFVDYKTWPYILSAWWWLDNDCIWIVGRTTPLIRICDHYSSLYHY